MPVYASAQAPDRITILEDFGSYGSGEPMFIYGQVAGLEDGSFLIMQIINPQGDLCQIQQLMPLPNGVFITDVIPLKGRICGIPGEYEIRLFYGDNTKSTTFDVAANPFSGPGPDQKISRAKSLVSDWSLVVSRLLAVPSPVQGQTPDSLPELESAYVGMWDEFFVDDFIVEVSPLIRPAVSSLLDSAQQLLDEDEISPEIAESIDRTVFSAVFYYEIGDRAKAIDLLADAFVDIRNVDPEKNAARTPTFDELEETLLSLMTKTDTVMSKPVKSEIGFIFARGIGPIYSEELADLADVLSKSRYLDVISRNQNSLYKLVQNDWQALKPSLEAKSSIAELTASSERVSGLHQAAILLRELDKVKRFISSDSRDRGLADLITPKWERLESGLVQATSVEDILDSEEEIRQMTQILDISSRISKSVEISQTSGLDSPLVNDWRLLLEQVKNAGSPDEILEIVSEFDQSMTELREKRNPLIVLEFQYNAMKAKAELQSDYENLFLIDNALRILDTAKQMESGNPSITRIDRIEVLLTWASQQAPVIQADLDSYSRDVYKVRAGDILQRAKSLENLVELSLTKNRFLPNYVEFADGFNEKIDRVRDLVVENDLDQADGLVGDLFDEWSLVSEAYANDPHGSDVGYTVDELKRIEFRKKLDAFSNMVSVFYNGGFAGHVAGYDRLMAEANELVDIANFVDAESKVAEISDYLSEHLVLNDPSVIYGISYDDEKNIWIMQGVTEKSLFDRREDLHVTVYNMDGSTHSSLEFTDTKQGNFYTQWVAPADPGLYVVMLQYRDAKATQIVHVQDDFGYEYDQSDMDMVDLAREFDELRSFAERFGGPSFDENPRFASVISEIRSGLQSNNAGSTADNIDELRTIIERYLPIRNPAAPIEATYDGDRLVITGRVLKIVEFSEDLFIDVYDQRGSHIEEIILKDDPTGLFSETVYRSLDPGLYVVQLQYNNIAVTDFFRVR